MSVATPTLLPRPEIFPHLLPKPPQPHPTPLPKSGRSAGRFNTRRDLQREMDDLSDEENELDELNTYIRNRGYNFLIPIGRTLTQQEEKNDADDDSDDSDSGQSGNPTSPVDDGENESNADLDASMEDLDDETGDLTAETEDADELGEGDTEFEEEPSDT